MMCLPFLVMSATTLFFGGFSNFCDVPCVAWSGYHCAESSSSDVTPDSNSLARVVVRGLFCDCGWRRVHRCVSRVGFGVAHSDRQGQHVYTFLVWVPVVASTHGRRDVACWKKSNSGGSEWQQWMTSAGLSWPQLTSRLSLTHSWPLCIALPSLLTAYPFLTLPPLLLLVNK